MSNKAEITGFKFNVSKEFMSSISELFVSNADNFPTLVDPTCLDSFPTLADPSCLDSVTA
ncbi:MAG TPA: hypothetical protein VGQ93_08505 [Lysobacter sp.]|jgi:hypothetical protein|nr:hypothetical protein [Lysobacter sp.]